MVILTSNRVAAEVVAEDEDAGEVVEVGRTIGSVLTRFPNRTTSSRNTTTVSCGSLMKRKMISGMH